MKLHHAIETNVPHEAVHKALTTVDQMPLRHKGEVTGDITPVKRFYLLGEKGLNFFGRTERLTPSRDIKSMVENRGATK